MKRSVLAISLPLVLVGALNVMAHAGVDFKTHDKFENCQKMSEPGQTDCLVKLVPDMRKHLDASDAFGTWKLQYAQVLLQLNDQLKPPVDKEYLRNKIAAYEGALQVEQAAGARNHNYVPMYRALVDYFTRLGPAYKADVVFSGKQLSLESNVQAIRSGGDATPGWLAAVQTAVGVYQARTAPPSPTGAGAPSPADSGTGASRNGATAQGGNKICVAVHPECMQWIGITHNPGAYLVKSRNVCSFKVSSATCYEVNGGGWLCAGDSLDPGAIGGVMDQNYVPTGRYTLFAVEYGSGGGNSDVLPARATPSPISQSEVRYRESTVEKPCSGGR